MHETMNPGRETPASAVEGKGHQNGEQKQQCITLDDATKTYANLAPNPYFRKSAEKISTFPLALTLRFNRKRQGLAGRIFQYAEEQTADDRLLEDHSNEQNFHLLLFLKNSYTLKGFLEKIGPTEKLYSNTSGEQLPLTELKQKAARLMKD